MCNIHCYRRILFVGIEPAYWMRWRTLLQLTLTLMRFNFVTPGRLLFHIDISIVLHHWWLIFNRYSIISIPGNMYCTLNGYLLNCSPNILWVIAVLRIFNISVDKNCPEITSLHDKLVLTKKWNQYIKMNFYGNKLMRKTSELSSIDIMINHLRGVNTINFILQQVTPGYVYYSK